MRSATRAGSSAAPICRPVNRARAGLLMYSLGPGDNRRLAGRRGHFNYAFKIPHCSGPADAATTWDSVRFQ